MSEADFRAAAGKRIRQERLRLGWSQEELAEKADVHPSFIGQLERGLRAASFKTLVRLSAVFGLKPADFLQYSPVAKTIKPGPISEKIAGLLRGCSEHEQKLVYQTIRHLLRQNRRLSK